MILKHKLQLEILQNLLYAKELRYSELKEDSIDPSQFVFHIDRLIQNSLIKKTENGYSLTKKGMEIANRMDLGDTQIHYQAKLSVILCCVRGTKNDQEYLLYTRKKNPFYSFQGFPTGKVKYGETIISAAQRELYEETKLSGNPELFAIRHSTIRSLNNQLLEDKIFYACLFSNPTGILKTNNEGDFCWVRKEEVTKYLVKPVQEIPELLTALENYEGTLTFKEDTYKTAIF
ncbi:NUDIX hydrolase [Candidatus Dojkabacteria bacterium]|uniref:NUDIX hydrolase n=1 Tax=Candidatus Dojkabacteria bacterium TaxID=2099670 RepID=A0A955L8T7_9BACT|nr:NUDIX hydrolase [Candidatus Dojkabacteria bacterium]